LGGGIKVYLDYLGCRLNESEIEALAWRFVEGGHQIVRDPAQADLCVVNTCTVTQAAARKSRQLVRRLARQNPQVQIAVTGCHATLAPQEMARLPNVAWVVNNTDKARLATLVAPTLSPAPAPASRHLGPGALGRTRAFVKVQDGCDNHCTFCVTTLARGPAHSRPRAEVIAEVGALVAAGYQEIVLTGVHLGAYGHDLAQRDGLHALVAALLAETSVPRLRLSSLEPWDLSPDFFDLWADSRLCRQLHLPLQSGCDAVLRRMGRRATTADFGALVDAARARIPGLALTTDLIVGFPGETEAEFQASYALVESLDFARLHVFPYSPRPGTAAARMPDPVSAQVKAERGRVMRRLGARQAHRFRDRFLGHTLPVLWETWHGEDVWHGLTDNYLSVTASCAVNLANRITPTRLVRTAKHGVWGVPVLP